MKIVLETSDWNMDIPNHVYVLNDSMTKMIAYVKAGTKKVIKFSKPMGFDTRGRSFIDLDDAEPDVRDPEVITVEGSNGNRYYLSNHGEGWICTCPGYKYHGYCKHTKGRE